MVLSSGSRVIANQMKTQDSPSTQCLCWASCGELQLMVWLSFDSWFMNRALFSFYAPLSRINSKDGTRLQLTDTKEYWNIISDLKQTNKKVLWEWVCLHHGVPTRAIHITHGWSWKALSPPFLFRLSKPRLKLHSCLAANHTPQIHLYHVQYWIAKGLLYPVQLMALTLNRTCSSQ